MDQSADSGSFRLASTPRDTALSTFMYVVGFAPNWLGPSVHCDSGHATRVILSLKSLLKSVRPAFRPAPSS
ncbi:hypothetical protein D3C81_2329020 [compost metagenome]